MANDLKCLDTLDSMLGQAHVSSAISKEGKLLLNKAKSVDSMILSAKTLKEVNGSALSEFLSLAASTPIGKHLVDKGMANFAAFVRERAKALLYAQQGTLSPQAALAMVKAGDFLLDDLGEYSVVALKHQKSLLTGVGTPPLPAVKAAVTPAGSPGVAPLVNGLGHTFPELKAMDHSKLYQLLTKNPAVPGKAWQALKKDELIDAIMSVADADKLALNASTSYLKRWQAYVGRAEKAADSGDMAKATKYRIEAAKARLAYYEFDSEYVQKLPLTDSKRLSLEWGIDLETKGLAHVLSQDKYDPLLLQAFEDAPLQAVKNDISTWAAKVDWEESRSFGLQFNLAADAAAGTETFTGLLSNFDGVSALKVFLKGNYPGSPAPVPKLSGVAFPADVLAKVDGMTHGEAYKLLANHPDVPGKAAWQMMSVSDLRAAIKEVSDPDKLEAWTTKAHEVAVAKFEARYQKALAAGDHAKSASAKKLLDKAEDELKSWKASGGKLGPTPTSTPPPVPKAPTSPPVPPATPVTPPAAKPNVSGGPTVPPKGTPSQPVPSPAMSEAKSDSLSAAPVTTDSALFQMTPVEITAKFNALDPDLVVKVPTQLTKKNLEAIAEVDGKVSNGFAKPFIAEVTEDGDLHFIYASDTNELAPTYAMNYGGTSSVSKKPLAQLAEELSQADQSQGKAYIFIGGDRASEFGVSSQALAKLSLDHGFSQTRQSALVKPGVHETKTLVDRAGDEWIFKPAQPGDEFLVWGEHAANVAGSKLGLPTAPSQVVIQGGRVGPAQKLFKGSETVPVDPSDLTKAQAEQLIQFHVHDWLISNHDAHRANFLKLPDGTLAPIDKGQTFKTFATGQEDQLSTTYLLQTPEPYYNEFWRKVDAGAIEVDLNVASETVLRAASISDHEWRELWAPYARGDKKLLDKIVSRKNSMVDDWNKFLGERSKKSGLPFTKIEKPGGVSPGAKAKTASPTRGSSSGSSELAGATPIDDQLAARVAANSSNGTPLFIAGTEVEYGQVLLDTYVTADGVRKLRVTGRLMPDADAVVSALAMGRNPEIEKLKKKLPAKTPPKPKLADFEKTSVPPGFEDVVSGVTSGAKTVSYHVKQGDMQYSATKMEGLEEAIKFLSHQVTAKGLANLAKVYGDEFAKKVSTLHDLALEVKKAASQGVQAPMIDISLEVPLDPAKAKAAYEQAVNAWALQRTKDAAIKKKIESEIHAIQKAEGGPAGIVFREEAWVKSPAIDYFDPATKEAVVSSVEESIAMSKVHAAEVDGVSLRYQDYSSPHISLRGRFTTEVELPDGVVTSEAIEQALTPLKRSGAEMRVATDDDIRLTYHRVVYGHESGKIDSYLSKLLEPNADGLDAKGVVEARVSKLGRPATAKEEADFWEDEVRGRLGPQPEGYWRPRVGTASGSDGGWARSYLPVGERPEDLLKTWGDDNYVLFHSWYNADAGTLADAMRNTSTLLSSQERRLRVGLHGDSMSADEDLRVGGAGFVYTRVGQSISIPSHSIIAIVSPRAAYRLGTVSHTRDRYGALAARSDGVTKPENMLGRLAARTDNETIIPQQVSFVDDLEALMVQTKSDRTAVLKALKEAGLPDEIRGVPLSERVVVGRQGMVDFIDKHKDSIYSWD